MIHAEDDVLIPHERSLELLEIAKKYRPKDYPEIRLFSIHRIHEIGHAKLYLHDEAFPVVKYDLYPFK